MNPYDTIMFMSAQMAARDGKEASDTYRAQMKMAEQADRNYRRAQDYGRRLEHASTQKEADSIVRKIKNLQVRNDNLRERYNRTFASDDAGTASPAQAAAIAGTAAGVACLLIGGYALGPIFHPAPQTEKPKPLPGTVEVVAAPADTVFHVENGTLYNGSHAIGPAEVLEKINTTILFTDQQLQSSLHSYLDDAYNHSKIAVNFNPDASVDVKVTDNSLGVTGIGNHIGAADAHAKVYPKLSGTFYNTSMKYAFLPVDPENIPDDVNGSVWRIDDSMKSNIRNITGTSTDFNAINFSYNGSGNLTASLGVIGTDGNFTFVDKVKTEKIRNCLYRLADNDDDRETPVDDMLEHFKDNAIGKSLKGGQALTDYLHTHYVNTAWELDSLIDGLGNDSRALDGLLGNNSVADPDSLQRLIDNLTANSSLLNKLLENVTITGTPNATMEQKLENASAVLNDTRNLLDKYKDKYDTTSIDALVDDLNGTIGKLNKYITDLQEPFTVDSIIDNINGTHELFLIMKEMKEMGRESYMLNLSNEREREIAENLTNPGRVEEMVAGGFTDAYFVDAFDKDGYVATVSWADKRHVERTEGVTAAAWATGPPSKATNSSSAVAWPDGLYEQAFDWNNVRYRSRVFAGCANIQRGPDNVL